MTSRASRTTGYIPDRGHLVCLSFDPRACRAQAGRCPELVLSPAAYNARAGLALVCPITSRAKGYPFEVALPTGLPVAGVVLADHIKSVDWGARRADWAGQAPTDLMLEVLARLQPLLSPL